MDVKSGIFTVLGWIIAIILTMVGVIVAFMLYVGIYALIIIAVLYVVIKVLCWIFGVTI